MRPVFIMATEQEFSVLALSTALVPSLPCGFIFVRFGAVALCSPATGKRKHGDARLHLPCAHWPGRGSGAAQVHCSEGGKVQPKVWGAKLRITVS